MFGGVWGGGGVLDNDKLKLWVALAPFTLFSLSEDV